MKSILLSLAILLEQFEENAWKDMYEAAPREFVESFGLDHTKTPDGDLFFCTKIPFVHFNFTNTIGLSTPVNPMKIDNLTFQYRQRHCPKAFVILSPFANPANIEELLLKAGFEPETSWDRAYRGNSALKPMLPHKRNLSVEEVNHTNGKEWSDFICNTYSLPTHSWLLALVGREGWHHFILRENKKIIEVRSMYQKDGFAWIGVDAPVPGLMTNDFEADYVLMHAMIRKGLSVGVKHFVTDIEKPDDYQKLDSYKYFRELDFDVEYRRKVFSLRLSQ